MPKKISTPHTSDKTSTDTINVRKSTHPIWNIPVYHGELWTAKQRQGHSLHQISYRACFKPHLVKFFLERFSKNGDIIYDPFMGRGTTPLEAALNDRIPWGSDLNPLASHLVIPRLSPPTKQAVIDRLKDIDLEENTSLPEDLLVFYHPKTLTEILSLRAYLLKKEQENQLDHTDRWIRMVALNRLTGHSPGFFSVYTMPPNQAVSIKSQQRINSRRQQTPPYRNISELILRKTRQLLTDCEIKSVTKLNAAATHAKFSIANATQLNELPDNSVDLIITSPPFLDVVNYATDNWLRCWFCGIEAHQLNITTPGKLSDWENFISKVFIQLKRILKPSGRIAIEIGEVRKGSLKLDEIVAPLGTKNGLILEAFYINDQNFTKTAHCWGVANQKIGTNTNRIIIFKKEE
jgi:DNA modification methylase